MPDKPCAHCGGTGKEPDPVGAAWDNLETAIGCLPAPDQGKLLAAAHAYLDATLDRRAEHESRITFLEAALRDILDHVRVPDERPGNAFISQFQASYESLDGWRAILDGAEPQPKTINQARAEHGLPPLPATIGDSPLSAYPRVHADDCGYGGLDHTGTCFPEC